MSGTPASRPAAEASRRRSLAPIGSLLRDRIPRLVTNFFSGREQVERELSSALRCMSCVVMSTKPAGALAARRELVRLARAGFGASRVAFERKRRR